ncbi:SanA protein [Ereboglobus sp. PH5-10]|uniref:SanA/YdcF family protein n=1 Tax=Ereboglobus sp. PH5-10 TaxID=2940629 RepID=UPI002404B69E|nr:ElyC/SanA/YdcF family protein [Ereboglobus sp. PH5-10]MDF9827651.1 SanA protein [Ereboglobus sp. PH5-10]
MRFFIRKQEPDAATPFHRRIRWLRVAGALAVASVLFVAFANYYIITASRDYIYDDIASVPARDVGLVLGASSHLADGRENMHFVSRMDAAAALYHAGKARHLLVSGDNHSADYDEPTAMKNALIARGVPADAITCDFAGFRTYDSVVRAKEIFGLSDRVVIVTQRYHNTRAVTLARANGIGAIGFCARDVVFRHSIRTEIREVVSRTFAMLEIYIFPHKPRHLGPREPIVLSKVSAGAPQLGMQ